MEECQARNVDKKINATCTVNNLNKMIVFFLTNSQCSIKK